MGSLRRGRTNAAAPIAASPETVADIDIRHPDDAANVNAPMTIGWWLGRSGRT
jgi:hypothetical protein